MSSPRSASRAATRSGPRARCRAKRDLPLFAGDLDGEGIVEPAVHLPQMTEGEEVVEDYVAMRLTLRTHPMAFLRPRLSQAAHPGAPAPT